MDYAAYIVPAYGFAAFMLGGLVVHTWVSARRASRALARKDGA